MKTYKNILIIIFAFFAFSCKNSNNLDFLNSVTAPSNLTAVFDITQDNSGLVSILVTAEGVTEFEVVFGDQENETPTKYSVDALISHTYSEGTFNVVITAVGITGLTTELTKEINVTFKAPENLVVTDELDIANPKKLNVTANADFATIIDIYYGDVDNEVPEHILPGESTSHIYSDAGDYILRVVAKSGGAATTEFVDTITITNAVDPINLPITFESFTVNYAFVDFGNALTSLVDNPHKTGINTSDKVALFVKQSGAETWAGTTMTIENPIDFSTNNLFKIMVYSPKSGSTVKLKVENLTDGNISYEVDATTTVTNQWEELSFDFSAISLINDYQKLSIFFDFGNSGDGSSYYYDNIRLIPNVISDLTIENFEGTAPSFTNFDGGVATVISNPVSSGINTSANVGQMVKNAGEIWGGSYFSLASPIDFTLRKTFKMKVYSNKIGTKVLLKVENLTDGGINFEKEVLTTVANQWEELTFDYSTIDDTKSYQNITLIFDNGTMGDGSADFTYYFDDIILTN